MAIPFSGGTKVNQTFTGASRAGILDGLKTNLPTAGWTSRAYSQVGGGVGNVGTFTVTIASPGVVTFNSHGFENNDVVILQTTGALPTGLSVNTRYFVRNKAANTFELSTTSGGSSINTTGSQSGTHTLNSESFLWESAVQANVTNPIRIRAKDNRGNCIQFTVENSAGTVAGTSGTGNGQGGCLLPAAAKTFRILASQFHFMCFTPGVSAAREFIHCGMPYVPTDLTGVTDIGFVMSNTQNDGSSSSVPCLRFGPFTCVGSNTPQSNSAIYQTNLFEQVQDTNHSGSLQILVLGNFTDAGGSYIGTSAYRWANDAKRLSEVLISWGLTSNTDEGKIKGNIYDLAHIADNFAIDSTDTFNGHTWFCLSNGAAGSFLRGGMWWALD